MGLLALFKRKYYSLNTIEISKKALLANYSYLSELSKNIVVAPVIKSNAYGHGVNLVAKILDGVNAPFICVDSLYEAYQLLKLKIKTPVLIMGYINPQDLKIKKLPFSYAVYDRDLATAINKYQDNAKIHIFVDTGMHREGIDISELPRFMNYIKSLKNIEVEGVMSNLAAGENNEATKKQIENFEKAKEIIYSAGFKPKWFHIAASIGLLHHADYKDKLGNLARCGISLYGYDPEGKNKKLQPALTFKTTLNQVKNLKKGERVGYDFTYTAKKDMTIGILPIGYNDGVDRRLSNKGFVLIKNSYCPIIGKVSMNITTIDISSVKNPRVGDQVIVYSNNNSDKNSIFNTTQIIGDIPYVLLVHLASSTRRIEI